MNISDYWGVGDVTIVTKIQGAVLGFHAEGGHAVIALPDGEGWRIAVDGTVWQGFEAHNGTWRKMA